METQQFETNEIKNLTMADYQCNVDRRFLSTGFIFESFEKSPTCCAHLVIPSCKPLDRSELPLLENRRINRCVLKGQAAAAIHSGSEDGVLTPKLQNVMRICAPSCPCIRNIILCSLRIYYFGMELQVNAAKWFPLF